MAWNMLDTHELMGLMRHTEEPNNFFLNRYFNTTQTFNSEYIDFEMVAKGKKLAPFVSPMAKGKVLKDQGAELKRFKPAYIKPKHALDATKVIKRRPGEAIGGSLSNAQRSDAIMMEYMQDQRDIIERRWEWMAAQAIMNGSVTISGDDYPTSSVDFGRDAGHTVVKGASNWWGDSGVSIIDDLQGWIDTMRKAQFGGPVTDLIVSPAVFSVMRKDAELKDLMDNNYRGSSDELNRSLIGSSAAQQVGTIGGYLNVIVYQDWYQDDAGNATNFMADNEILLVGPNVGGVRAFGAIMDDDANYQATTMFSKMFKEPDPSAVFMMTQSSPLMIPVNPNNTFKAQVLA